jgi:hypothetical protein
MQAAGREPAGGSQRRFGRLQALSSLQGALQSLQALSAAPLQVFGREGRHGLGGKRTQHSRVSVGLIHGLRRPAKSLIKHQMFSHIVIFWTDPDETNATEEVIASAKRYLASIPGVMNFHAGKMARSHRGVVDQSYQVALNLQFETKQAQDEYQDHPLHLEFVEKCKPLWTKVVVYDFE